VRALVVGLLAGVLEYAPIIVMAEGAVPREDTLATHEGELDAFGHARLGGIGARLEWEIEVRTGKAARATVLVTSSAADHRRRTTGCSRHVLGLSGGSRGSGVIG